MRVIAAALTAPQVQADYLGGFISSVTPPSPNNGIVVALPPDAFGAPAQIGPHSEDLNYGSIEALQNGLKFGAGLLFSL